MSLTDDQIRNTRKHARMIVARVRGAHESTYGNADLVWCAEEAERLIVQAFEQYERRINGMRLQRAKRAAKLRGEPRSARRTDD